MKAHLLKGEFLMNTCMDKLYDAVADRGPVCVGLDTDVSYLPEGYARPGETAGESILRFNRAVIDATKAAAACYKVQIAYYEALGLDGLRAYAETLKAVRAEGIPVIADIKRGDIAKTAEMYAQAHFSGELEADFITLAPYMGLDSLSPYLPYAEKQGKGMFVLCRTSNPGAKDFEYQPLADGRRIYDLVGDAVSALGAEYIGEHGYSSLGLVIGGTHAEEASEIRTRYQNSFFLIPGYGAQGGKASDIALYLQNRNGGVVNSSRGILLAYKKQPGTAFDEAAYNECIRMKEDIRHACDLL
jgi:orotidine-5'-phosphate decarboxylase